MSTPPKSRQEHAKEYPSTYVVQDRANEEELIRLTLQDRTTTVAMGGVLGEQPDPLIFERVLDVGCGTGGWLIEAAKTYPKMSLLIGIDVSSKMIEYARVQAEAEAVSNRVEFQVMDALRILEFPNNYFDLVNERFGTSYLRTWDWPRLLQEFQRLTRPGGVIRVSESDMATESTSPALTRLFDFALAALYQAGRFFTSESKGVTGELARLLDLVGLQDVQTRAYTLESRAGTVQGENFAENMKHLFRTLTPFLQKWTRVPDDYEELYQQMLKEVRQPGFVATGGVVTAWGTKPL